VQGVSKGFLELENIIFGEGVEDTVDVLVGEDCERHIEDPMFVCQLFWWRDCVVV
jgi:hypothetical protein